jgi:hypothetical protein
MRRLIEIGLTQGAREGLDPKYGDYLDLRG